MKHPLGREERDAVIYQLHDDGLTQRQIAKHVKSSVSTVNTALQKRKLDNLSNKEYVRTEQVKNAIKESREIDHARVMELVNSATFASIGSKTLSLLNNDHNLEMEVEKRGIANLYRLFGMIADKVMNAEHLVLEKRKLDIREKELDIKLKELELRIQRPEAFHEVHIINDAPEDTYATAD